MELYPEGTFLRARFVPRRTDDLKPDVSALIGQTLDLISDGQINAALSAMDGSSYGGEYYFCPLGRSFDSGYDWWWIPSGDFENIEILTEETSE